MNNIYLFEYNDDFLFHKELSKILSNINATKDEIEKMTLEEVGIEAFLNSANTIPFLEDKRVIIAETDTLFKVKNEFDKDVIKRLITYLEKPLLTTFIIFKTRSTDKTSNIFNIVKNYHSYRLIESLDAVGLKNLINHKLSLMNISIEKDAMDELLSRCADNAERIDNELDKLLSYKENGQIVKKEDIELLVANDIERNAYEIIKAILQGNKEIAFREYSKLMESKIDATTVINFMAGRLREVQITKELMQNGHSKAEIADVLKISPGKAYYVMEDCKRLRMSDLNNIISRLSELDYGIKSGKLDKSIGFEMILLKI